MAFGKRFSKKKPIGMDQLCQMQDGLIYVYTKKKVIAWV